MINVIGSMWVSRCQTHMSKRDAVGISMEFRKNPSILQGGCHCS